VFRNTLKRRPRVATVVLDGTVELWIQLYDSEGPLARPRVTSLYGMLFLEGLFYPLPLHGRGRSSCPVRASYGSGAEQ
jgi:hypothetical protein